MKKHKTKKVSKSKKTPKNKTKSNQETQSQNNKNAETPRGKEQESKDEDSKNERPRKDYEDLKKEIDSYLNKGLTREEINGVLFIFSLLTGFLLYLAWSLWKNENPFYPETKSVNPFTRNIIGFNALVSHYLPKNFVEAIMINDKTAFVQMKNGETVKIKINDRKSFERLIIEEQIKSGTSQIDLVPLIHVFSDGSKLSRAVNCATYLAYIMLLGLMLSGFRDVRRMFKPMNSMKPVGRKLLDTRFKDVAGLKNAKLEVEEIVSLLRDNKRFLRLGARIPRGALLVGPPGTGKTLIAKAIAGESGCSFFSMSGSEFRQMYVGLGAARIRELFHSARKAEPAIIFIDEIDAIGGKRSSRISDEERDNTLNQLLVEMDGFKTSVNVIVLAGTNRADKLDDALLRAGRFDRRINIDLPDILERTEIFKLYLKAVKINEPLEEIAGSLAALTPGFSGADVANVCNEGAIVAARMKKESVSLPDFEKALDRVIAGLEKSKSVYTEAEKRLVAVHEAGHAVVAWFLEHASPLLKISISPRSGESMGFSQFLPKEVSIYTREQLLASMAVALGGRAAEELYLGQISTGASDDLEKITHSAFLAVRKFGMSSRVGNLSFPDGDEWQKPLFSEEMAALIDEEADALVNATYDTARSVLRERQPLLEKMVERLLAQEVMNHEDIAECLGKREHESFQYKEYLKSTLESVSKKVSPPENLAMAEFSSST